MSGRLRLDRRAVGDEVFSGDLDSYIFPLEGIEIRPVLPNHFPPRVIARHGNAIGLGETLVVVAISRALQGDRDRIAADEIEEEFSARTHERQGGEIPVALGLLADEPVPAEGGAGQGRAP